MLNIHIVAIVLSLIVVANCGLKDILGKIGPTGHNHKYNYDDDIPKDATQLIESRGFKSEPHNATTSDGYTLTMFRVINPYWKGKTKRSVLFMHGIIKNGDGWLLNTYGQLNSNGSWIEETDVVTDCSGANPKAVGNTVPFALSACGYDVWIGNQRGTKYSLGHSQYNAMTDKKYWSYSVDELGLDLVAYVNYIKDKTGSENVAYMGHSLASSIMLQVLTENQEMNKIMKPIILNGPVIYLGHTTSLSVVFNLVEPLLSSIGDGPLFLLPPKQLNQLDTFVGDLCGHRLIGKLCEALSFTFSGINFQDNDPDKFGSFLAHDHDSSTFKVLAQIVQRTKFHTFSKFDYKLQNLAKYKQVTPPKYDLSQITTPDLHLVLAKNDPLVVPEDLDIAKSELKVKLAEEYWIPDERYQHFDFLRANNAGEFVTWKALTILNKYSQ